MQPILRILALALCAGACAAEANPPRLQVTPLELGAGADASSPSLAVEPGRGFVATWQRRVGAHATLEFAEIAPGGEVVRRGVIADSARSGAQGAAARWFVNWADFPSLVVLDNGDWVAHWLQRTGDGTYAYEVRVVRSTDRGRTWSASIVPHDDGTPTEHGFVSLLPAGGDRVRLVWLDGRETGGGHGDDHAGHAGGAMTLRSVVLDGNGTRSQHRLLDPRVCDCCQTAAVRHAGRTVVAYRDRGTDELRNIHWVAEQGGQWRADRMLHDDGWRIAACPVNGPALAAGPAGVLALWPTMRGEAMVVRAALAVEHRFGAPVELESGIATLGRVDAAAFGDGRFLAVWLGAGRSAGATALRLVELDAGLRVRASHDVAELAPGRSTGMPRIAASGREAVLAWVEATDGRPGVRAVRIVAVDGGAGESPPTPGNAAPSAGQR